MMTPSFKRLTALLNLTALLAALIVTTGCETTPSEPVFEDYTPGVWTTPTQSQSTTEASTTGAIQRTPADVFRVGDMVAVTFSGTSEDIAPHQERIKDDGTITLFLIGSVVATNKSPGELQKELQKKYNAYYKTLVVTVQSFQRVYYVGGEVKKAGPVQYLGETTVTKAIQAAGDFTDFAKKSSIRVIRANGTTLKVNFKKAIENPSQDPPIFPGDKIYVPRRIFW